jgi:hypothetical protein
MVGSLLLVALLVGQAPSTSPPIRHGIPPGWMEIDGAKNPEQIPEWATWSSGFDTLALLRAHNVPKDAPPLVGLASLSEKDAALLAAALEEYLKIVDRCTEEGRRGLAAVQSQKDVTQEAIDKFANEFTLQCRIEKLESKDRLPAKMTDEGRDAVNAWMVAGRRKMKAIMPKDQLIFYWEPR